MTSPGISKGSAWTLHDGVDTARSYHQFFHSRRHKSVAGSVLFLSVVTFFFHLGLLVYIISIVQVFWCGLLGLGQWRSWMIDRTGRYQRVESRFSSVHTADSVHKQAARHVRSGATPPRICSVSILEKDVHVCSGSNDDGICICICIFSCASNGENEAQKAILVCRSFMNQHSTQSGGSFTPIKTFTKLHSQNPDTTRTRTAHREVSDRVAEIVDRLIVVPSGWSGGWSGGADGLQTRYT